MYKKKFSNPFKKLIKSFENYFFNVSRKLSLKYKNNGLTFRQVVENYLKVTYLLIFSIILNIVFFVLLII